MVYWGNRGPQLPVTGRVRAAAASTDGWTRSTNIGRVVTVETFSGRYPSGTPTGTVTTSYNANATTVTDQAGKLRRSIVNALGRLIRVDEPNSSGSLGSVTAPNQPTSYTYDSRHNLTQVAQGGQTRAFVYDGLSRLKQATNPESGAMNFSYDENGNLKTKTDARSVVTTFNYDGLNRVTTRTYSVRWWVDLLRRSAGRGGAAINMDPLRRSLEFGHFAPPNPTMESGEVTA